MTKTVGGIYWCESQETIAQIFRVDPESSWPFICGDLESTGDENPMYGDTFECDEGDLWDEQECLEEVERLTSRINTLKDYITQA